MATARRAVDLARTLRGTAGHQDPPAARAGCGSRCPAASCADRRRRCSRLIARRGQRQGRSSSSATSRTLVERRVKPLLPKIGKRLGRAIPAVMAAARDGRRRVSTPTAR